MATRYVVYLCSAPEPGATCGGRRHRIGAMSAPDRDAAIALAKAHLRRLTAMHPLSESYDEWPWWYVRREGG